MSEETHGVRIGRVENEVDAIKSDLTGLRSEVGTLSADVRGLVGILNRVEQGILRAQDQEARSKLNPVAVVTVIITVLSMMVGGAYLVGGAIARMDERSSSLQHQLDQNDQRLWELAGDHHDPSPQ